MKEQFWSSPKLGPKGLTQLETVNQVIGEYMQQGYRLTLRQLYYQLVARGLIPNKVQEYSKLGRILVRGRMSGLVDWGAIEDRTRIPHIPYWVNGVEGAIEDTIRTYRLDRQEGQEAYIEVWVEKDALSNIIKTITDHFHIRLMVNRGYSSCSAMHESFSRFRYKGGQGFHILYIGDHDPSGLDMVRDITDRLEEFGLIGLQVHPIALTMEQINKYSPPPNPAKVTDPRARWYISHFGNTSWEVDALEPKILHEVIKGQIEDLIDMDQFYNVIEQEQDDIIVLKDFLKKFEA